MEGECVKVNRTHLLGERKGDTVVQLTELQDLVVGTGLLSFELAWNADRSVRNFVRMGQKGRRCVSIACVPFPSHPPDCKGTL